MKRRDFIKRTGTVAAGVVVAPVAVAKTLEQSAPMSLPLRSCEAMNEALISFGNSAHTCGHAIDAMRYSLAFLCKDGEMFLKEGSLTQASYEDGINKGYIIPLDRTPVSGDKFYFSIDGENI